MARPWEVNPNARFERRLGKTAADLGDSRTTNDCPDIWQLVVVGRQALFEVRYDEHWAASGARRIDDRAVIDAANAEIAELWAQAEPLDEYFHREIAPLPPPVFGE